MEFLSERILRLAGLGETEVQHLNEGLAEEAVETHQPYQSSKTVEGTFQEDEDDKSDTNEINVDYAISESNRALVESRLRDAIRMELKAMLSEGDLEDDDSMDTKPTWGATGLKKVVRTGRDMSKMGSVGPGFKNWKN
jgi:hypothetical protein